MLESKRLVSKEKPLPAQLGEIIGGYELTRVLSHGGMGCVYHAVHAERGRPAAVKVLATALVLDEELVARFSREARIVNELRHSNIVEIYDFVELDDPRRLACIMEYIEGPTLKQVVRRKRMTVAQALNSTLQLISALRVVHATNVIHRDLKPTNIIVTGNLRSDMSQVPSLKVLDFGIAKVEDSPGEHKTASGTMLGTPAYMAPEQVAADSVSSAADIYALGELLYEMVSGRRAFPGSRAAVLRVKMAGRLPALPIPQGIRSADAIRELVGKCIAHDPNDRPTLAQVEAEVQAIKAFSTEDLGLEILDGEQPTDVHEIPTRPISLPPIDEPATTVEVLEPVFRDPSVREGSSLDEPVPTASIAIPLARPKHGRWMIAAAAALIAMVAIAMTAEQSARDPAPPAPPPKKAMLVPPVTVLAPPPPPVPAPAPVRPVAKPRPIAISSRPNAVVLDAKTEARLGRTPMELELPRGTTMELLLVAPGRKPESVTIDGKHAHVAIDLEKARTKKREKREPLEDAPPPPPPPAPPPKKSVMPEW